MDKSINSKYSNLPVIPGKSPERVKEMYLDSPSDWKDQYHMLLMDNETCGDCIHSIKCNGMFRGDNKNTRCQFHPNRFVKKQI